jgi:hypothetical protein
MIRTAVPNSHGSRFEFLDEIGHSSARKLLKEGFVIGTRKQGGMIKITQAGLMRYRIDRADRL